MKKQFQQEDGFSSRVNVFTGRMIRARVQSWDRLLQGGEERREHRRGRRERERVCVRACVRAFVFLFAHKDEKEQSAQSWQGSTRRPSNHDQFGATSATCNLWVCALLAHVS